MLRTFDHRAKIAALKAALIRANAPAVTDINVHKVSRNAVVFIASWAGDPVFIKQYDHDYGPRLVRDTVEETAIVQSQMDGQFGGVVDVVWSSEPEAIVVMTPALGLPVSEVLRDGDAADLMPCLGGWLAQYVGERIEADRFSTSYWLKTRQAADLGALRATDRALLTDLLSVQSDRQRQLGTVPAYKARLPKDFAPHNLHWTGQSVWGFDIEGYSKRPVSRIIATFCILAERALPDPGNEPRRHGLQLVCQDALEGAFKDYRDPPDVFAYYVADGLFERALRRHDDPVVMASMRKLIQAHLSDA